MAPNRFVELDLRAPAPNKFVEDVLDVAPAPKLNEVPRRFEDAGAAAVVVELEAPKLKGELVV